MHCATTSRVPGVMPYLPLVPFSGGRWRRPAGGMYARFARPSARRAEALRQKGKQPFHHSRPIYLLMARLLDFVWEMPLPSVLDDTDTDRLLVMLRLVHGEPRFDIAPELIAARRRARLKLQQSY